MTKRRARRRTVFRTQEAERAGETRRHDRSPSCKRRSPSLPKPSKTHIAWCHADLHQDVDRQDNYVRCRRPVTPSSMRMQRSRTRMIDLRRESSSKTGRHCRTTTRVEHRSHRDGRARGPDWPDFTVHAQWQRAPRISRRSCSRTCRSATMSSG